MAGLFDGFFGPSASERAETARREHEDQLVWDHGPRGALQRLREEDPDRYETTQPSDIDRSWGQ